MSNQNSKLDKIKSSLGSRNWSMAKLTLSTGAKYALNTAKAAFASASEREKNWEEFLMEQMNLLAGELGQLKGTLMKAGQMLSIFGEHFLPPKAVEILKSLQFQSPPLKWEEIDKVIRDELSDEALADLEFEKEPVGAASIGQVHKAFSKSKNRWLAFKIQYVGIGDAIDSDMRALRGILSAANLLPQASNTDEIFEEVRQMLHQEMDYELEAAFTEDYRRRVEHLEGYRVPEVFREYSTKKILCTEYLEGVGIESESVKALSQERRNRLGKLFIDVYFKELFEWGQVQTDPHPGNYKILLDDQNAQDELVLLDFGAMRSPSDEFLVPYRKMISEVVRDRRERFEKACLELGFLEPDDPDSLRDSFWKLCRLIVEPFHTNREYNWGESDLPQRVLQEGKTSVREFRLRTPPREIIFLDRKLGGVFVFQTMLKTRFAPLPCLEPYMVE